MTTPEFEETRLRRGRRSSDRGTRPKARDPRWDDPNSLRQMRQAHRWVTFDRNVHRSIPGRNRGANSFAIARSFRPYGITRSATCLASWRRSFFVGGQPVNGMFRSPAERASWSPTTSVSLTLFFWAFLWGAHSTTSPGQPCFFLVLGWFIGSSGAFPIQRKGWAFRA